MFVALLFIYAFGSQNQELTYSVGSDYFLGTKTLDLIAYIIE